MLLSSLQTVRSNRWDEGVPCRHLLTPQTQLLIIFHPDFKPEIPSGPADIWETICGFLGVKSRDDTLLTSTHSGCLMRALFSTLALQMKPSAISGLPVFPSSQMTLRLLTDLLPYVTYNDISQSCCHTRGPAEAHTPKPGGRWRHQMHCTALVFLDFVLSSMQPISSHLHQLLL